ncbi:hypothetical protein R0381_003625 [Jeongeupia wiesaeckerbachi]|uniref:hypothetical protein n=1 Tax=Jeongeupia wiesaeckerbachi TaxID=3051218 RepID=UPI003D8079D0
MGFAQPAFAGLAETTKKSQIDYEKDLTQPKAGYLAAIAKVGADIQYVVTGVRSTAALTEDEQELLGLFRAAPLAVKASAVAGLKAGSAPTAPTKGPRYTVDYGNAQIGQASAGDIVNKNGKKK